MAARIAIFSDIHANLSAMEVVRDDIQKGNYDAVYCPGDLGGYASRPNAIQRLIMEMKCPELRNEIETSFTQARKTLNYRLHL